MHAVRFALRALLVAAIAFALLEGTLRLADSLGLFASQERFTEPADRFYRDEAAFGVWHPPNASHSAKASCYALVYRSNSHGARDRERSLRSTRPRVVVLGDSFVEGVGVELGKRMTDLLEEQTGIEHLNFGTAGNFSSIQEWQLYETLASRFDHDAVLVFGVPDDDFIENDPQRYWQPERYRPYLRRSGDGYEVFFTTTLDESARRAQSQLGWNRLYNASFVYRLIAFLDAQLRVRRAQGTQTPFGYVGYEQFSEADVERLLFSYRKIRDAAAGRPVVLFTIPRLSELRYLAGEGYPDRLPRRLAAFAEQEPNIDFVDLLPDFVDAWQRRPRSFGEYFVPCDGRWSELGNQVAADAVARAEQRLLSKAGQD